MNVIAKRLVAMMLLVIPGLMATWGFLLMKDVVFIWFARFAADDPSLADTTVVSIPWLKLVAGFVLFGVGVAFIGGWIFFRDRKNNYVAPRFREKRERRPRPTRNG